MIKRRLGQTAAGKIMPSRPRQRAASLSELERRIAEIESRLRARDPSEKAFHSDEALAAIAVRIYRARRRRARYFDPELFAEPAWDMLLDLFVAKVRGEEVGTSSLCLASSVPATTALRFLKVLERQGLVVRNPASVDRRVNLVSLSEHGRRLMCRYLIEGIEANELPRS